MGQTLTRARRPAPRASESARRAEKADVRVRCDEITPRLLESVAHSRVARTLGCVHVDCTVASFDDVKMDSLERAAGGVNKLVLYC